MGVAAGVGEHGGHVKHDFLAELNRMQAALSRCTILASAMHQYIVTCNDAELTPHIEAATKPFPVTQWNFCSKKAAELVKLWGANLW